MRLLEHLIAATEQVGAGLSYTDLFKKYIFITLLTTSIYLEVSRLKYLWHKCLHLRRVMSYNLVQFPCKSCSIVICFNEKCLQLLISLASYRSTDSCEVGMLWSIIVRNWTLCMTCVKTYFYRNSFAIYFKS